ncbi:MAG: hypothetical protein AAF235_04855 [Planctomycetota bacterium]
MTDCRFCSYPREGLENDNACPECGRPPRATLPPLAEEPIEHRIVLAKGARLARLACFVRIAHLISIAVLALTTDEAFWWWLWLGLAAIAGLNAAAAFRLTAKGRAPFRTWARPILRIATSLDVALASAGGIAHLATRDMPTVNLAIAIGVPAALLMTWVTRSGAWVAVIRSLAGRFDDDRLSRRITAWFTYAGVAAMTSVAGIIAVVLTALIPILAPFTVIAAIPYSLLMAVLGSIALIGAINLHVLVARELARVIKPT